MVPRGELWLRDDAMRESGAFTLPNALTLVRFPLAALFVLVDGFASRVGVVALAAASDWIDGRVARATRQVTVAGEVLDPIADKVFMLAALVTLATERLVPALVVPLLLTRDVGVALGVIVLAIRGRRMRMPARRAGKIVTWLQFAGIGAILLWPGIAWWVAFVVAAAGMFALQDYARALVVRARRESAA